METYEIKYYFFLEDGTKKTPTPINVKNSHNGVHAQIRLEAYLRKHNSTFKNMVVDSCKKVPPVLDIFKQFDEIFKMGGTK